MATDGDNYNKFIAEGALKAEGPLVSLLDKDATSITQQRAMVWLFGDCTALKDIKGLTFPQDISFNCFGMTFNGSGISAAPDELPAVTLTGDAYYGMFMNCSQLSDASNLTLKCTSIGSGACYSMFQNCAHLTAAPVIPDITASTTYSLDNMFYGCSTLAQLSVKFTSWPASMSNWLAGVSDNGTFYCPPELGDDSTIQRGSSRCPTGWNVVNVQPLT